jgi:hypothetical protein
MPSVQDILPPLTLEGMVTLFRQEVDDLPGDTVSDVNWKNDDTGLLWSNQEAVRYANRAVAEYCFRNPVLDSNVETTVTHVTWGTVPLDRRPYSGKILSIRRAKFVETASGDEHILQKRTLQWMDDYVGPNWHLEGAAGPQGTPKWYVEDHDRREICLYPVPEVAGVVHLTVDRLPIQNMEWTRRHLDGPKDIDEYHHLDLIDYMVYQAYLKRDAETENPELAKAALDRFTMNVGERPDARLLRVRRRERNYPRRARAVWF